MANSHVEYLGFTTTGPAREYLFRARQSGEAYQDFALTIPSEAFLSHRVRYQDGPEICFLRLQRELLASENTRPAARLAVTDAELDAYRIAHTPTARRRLSP